MKIWTDIETKVIDAFGIRATDIQMANGDEWMPSLAEVATFCMHEGYAPVYDKITADIFLTKIANKICEAEDSISLEDCGIFLLSHYFTVKELESMNREQVLQFLQDWKYYYGFRKADLRDADMMRWMAISLLEGRLEQVGDEEYFYRERERDYE